MILSWTEVWTLSFILILVSKGRCDAWYCLLSQWHLGSPRRQAFDMSVWDFLDHIPWGGVDSSFPWARVLDCIKRKKGADYQHSSLSSSNCGCCLILLLPCLSCNCQHPKTVSQKKALPSWSWFCQSCCYSHKTSNKTKVKCILEYPFPGCKNLDGRAWRRRQGAGNGGSVFSWPSESPNVCLYIGYIGLFPLCEPRKTLVIHMGSHNIIETLWLHVL